MNQTSIAQPVLEFKSLTKRFGPKTVVNDLTFSVRPGAVTGFLGPNGAGKTTTLRMLFGLTQPSSGSATISGRQFGELQWPGQTIGAALEASSFHPGRSARNSLRVYAGQIGVPDSRCDEVLALVGLSGAAKQTVGTFSMGMRQRLGLASALLGDPPVLVLDEPANGLDPEGIRWLRQLLRGFAAEGRTVLVSSHVLSEVQSTVDDVVIISRGALIRSCTLQELADDADASVTLRSTRLEELVPHVEARGWTHRPDDGAMVIGGASLQEVGELAFEAGVPVHELSSHGTDLEQVFLSLTAPEFTANQASRGDAA